MTESDIGPFVARIHAAPTRIVLAITGGGSRAIGQLLEVPGGSRTLFEAVVPYSAPALREWLGATPESYCSAGTARAMAMAAFWRARKLAASAAPDGAPAADSPLAGVACTASLVSDRPKRGAHRIHVALQTIAATVTHSIELAKGRRGRSDEEALAARLVLNAIAEAAGLADRLPPSAEPDERLITTSTVAPAAWQELLGGIVPTVRHEAGAIARLAAPSATGPSATAAARRALFAGAFHPLHAGHRRMAELAGNILATPVEFEISIENVDKPPLDFTEMAERLKQFGPAQTVWFTRAPTFAQGRAVSRRHLHRRGRHDPPHRRSAILWRRSHSDGRSARAHRRRRQPISRVRPDERRAVRDARPTRLAGEPIAALHRRAAGTISAGCLIDDIAADTGQRGDVADTPRSCHCFPAAAAAAA